MFQLFDWSQDLINPYNAIFAAEGAPETGAIFEEWLATVGLCRWSDTTCRPAWDVFLQQLKTLR